MTQNYRLWWGVNAIGIAANGITAYTTAHGVQSVGISNSFNLDAILELGQSAIYEQVEEIPDVEVTVEKVLDGYPLIYHLGTTGATAVDLINRSNYPCTMALSLFGDSQTAASGQPVAQCVMSGLFFSSVGYTFPVEGNCTESVTFVGNSQQWLTPANSTFSGNFTNTDVPLAETYGSGGVQRRVNVLFTNITGVGLDVNSQINATYAKPTTILPPDVQGISSSGTNDPVTGSQFKCSIQRINVQADAGRGKILELGRRSPYFRFLELPCTITTEIEIISKSGHSINVKEVGAYTNGFNTRAATIKVATQDGTFINCGTKNRLTSLTVGGGDTSGANQTLTYSFQTLDDFSVSNPQDPSNIS